VSQALAALLGAARYRAPPSHGGAVNAPGHYAGMLRVGRETIAVTTDTVGTKVLLADRLRRWEEVGEDIVGVNVNDLAAVGARAAGLVDTILVERPDPGIFRAIGRGMNRGLSVARCSLLGGETAVVPDLVHRFDLGGTAFGFFPAGRQPILGDAIRPGDTILGIPSNGAHANGYTLIRRILDEAKADLSSPAPGERASLGRALLRPTRIYTEAVDAVADLPSVHGLAHISGGGVRNLVRLREGVEFVLDEWPPVPSLFTWLKELGRFPDQELFQTFNAGVGFVLVVDREKVALVRARLARAGAPDARVIGTVGRGSGVSLPQFDLHYRGYS